MVVKLKQIFSKMVVILAGFCFVSIFIYINYIATEGFKAPVLKSLFLTVVFFGILVGLDLLLSSVRAKEQWYYGILIGMLIAGLLLRLYWIHSVDTVQVSDFLRMWQSAGEIAGGDFSRFDRNNYLYTYPHLAFPTLVYALVHKLSGGSLYVMKLVNVMLSIGSGWLIYRIASEMTGQKKAVALALAMTAMPFIFFNGVLDAQNLAIPFFYGGVLLYLKVFAGKINPLYLAGVGVCFGLGNLLRGVGLIFVLAVILHWMIYGSNISGVKLFSSKKKKLKLARVLVKPVLLLLMIVAMQATTILLNQLFLWNGIYQKPTWQTQGTLILYINAGLNHDSNGMWNQEDYDLLRDVDYDYDKAEIEARHRLKERLSDKDKVLSLLSRKFRTQWGTGDFGGKYWSTLEVNHLSPATNSLLVWLDYHFYYIQCFYSAMILVILVKLHQIYGKQEGEPLLFGLILFLGFVCLYSLIEMQPRYGYIVFPMIVALAGASSSFRRR